MVSYLQEGSLSLSFFFLKTESLLIKAMYFNKLPAIQIFDVNDRPCYVQGIPDLLKYINEKGLSAY